MKPHIFVAAGIALAVPFSAVPCSSLTPVDPVEMVARADVIVRARAEFYVIPPSPGTKTFGEPESIVQFRVEELICSYPLDTIVIPGYLEDADDFNELPSPYHLLRRGGRGGSCVANTYRPGAEYLLVLKQRGAWLTPYHWYALGPTNEQLHSPEDPWLLWVRAQVSR